jgi:hypothetical protein
MAQLGIPEDEGLAGGRWDWAFRLLRQMLDDEPSVGQEPSDEEEIAARDAEAAVAAPPSEAEADDAEAEAEHEAEVDDAAAEGGDEPADDVAETEETVEAIPADPADEGFYFGGETEDRLSGSDGDDLIDGMGGDDSLLGLAGDDLIDGGDGHDLLRGGDGDDILLGRDGSDTLEGGRGDDDLGGDAGDDWLTGGRGSDMFSVDLMAAGQPGVDTVTDFARGEDLLWIIGNRTSWQTLDSDGNDILDDADLAISVDAQGMRIALAGLQTGVNTEAAIVLLGIRELDTGDVILVDI